MASQDGDITLLVGDCVEMKAHQAVLEFASDVFKKMLQSCFLEGATKKIKLPEDDPDALRLILDVAHFRPVEYPEQAAIHQIALLIDKYNFIHMRATISLWWNNLWKEKMAMHIEDSAYWLELAFVVGDDEIFHKLTGCLVRQHSKVASFDGLLIENVQLPDSLPTQLEAQRQQLRFEIIVSLNALMIGSDHCSVACRTNVAAKTLGHCRSHRLSAKNIILRTLKDTSESLKMMHYQANGQFVELMHDRHCIEEGDLSCSELVSILAKVQNEAGLHIRDFK